MRPVPHLSPGSAPAQRAPPRTVPRTCRGCPPWSWSSPCRRPGMPQCHRDAARDRRQSPIRDRAAGLTAGGGIKAGGGITAGGRRHGRWWAHGSGPASRQPAGITTPSGAGSRFSGSWRMPGGSAPVDTVVMPGHQRDGAGPDARGRGAGGPVELVGDLDRPGAWMLLVDGVPQSHVDLDDPLHLELEYMRRLGHLIDLAAPAGEPLRVLHLGGGGLTLARYVAATRPGSHQLAVEAEPEVARLVRRRLPLARPGGRWPATGKITVRVADARAALEQVPAGSFDVVVADVFAGGRTPAHLTSVEFTRAAARALAAPGIYAANIADGPP